MSADISPLSKASIRASERSPPILDCVRVGRKFEPQAQSHEPQRCRDAFLGRDRDVADVFVDEETMDGVQLRRCEAQVHDGRIGGETT